MEDVDVVIVGAGPVGLLAALELTLAGSHVLVLERLGAPNTASKALGIGPLGSEALQRRGMDEAMRSAEQRTLALMQQHAEKTGAAGRGRDSRFSGHFGGLSLIRKDAQRQPERRMRAVDQHAVEAMLSERCAALGVVVRRECEVTDFVDSGSAVDVMWASSVGEEQVRCSYLVGCDGGRSTVRKLAGFDFPGTPPSLTMYNVVAEIDQPQLLAPAGWQRTSGGVFAYGFLPNRLVMLDFSGPPEDRDAPVTQLEVENVLRRISQKDVRLVSVASASRWTDNTRLVNHYRMGRVLLAGDAAHVHSPFGGQGLSLGLVDAANLGWKLAAVVRGDMPHTLLDSYGAERRPVAEAVLANTLAQAAIMRPDAQSGAMRDLLARLLDFDDVNRLIGEMMNGLGIRYDLSSARDAIGRVIGDFEVDSKQPDGSLYQLMQDGCAVLLDASANHVASRLVSAIAPRVKTVAVKSGPSMLIRPDACVAWQNEDNGIEGLDAALARWFKPAEPAVVAR